MLLGNLTVLAVKALGKIYPEQEARAIVARLSEALLGIAPYKYITDPELAVRDDAAEEFCAAVRRMETGEPLQYVLGFADFCGRRFRVGPEVLIPRQETEILCVETAAEVRRMMSARENSSAGAGGGCLRIADLCTGSGCIAWTLALDAPGACVLGADISAEALKTASSQADAVQESGSGNGAALTLAGEAAGRGASVPEFIMYDVLFGAGGFPGMYDVIVSNPPYVRDSEKALMHDNVLCHEPHLALFVPDDDPLKFYSALADFAKKRLLPGGFGMVEINEAFGSAVAGIFSSAGMSEVAVVNDFGGKNRFVRFRKPASVVL